jgi:hypothetical protein
MATRGRKLPAKAAISSLRKARSVDDDAGGNRPLVDFHVPLAARSLREVDNLCVAVDLGAALARPDGEGLGGHGRTHVAVVGGLKGADDAL